ncbi:hypothetical protein [Crassaminicella profunda]|uniref:hypothetical protein n=1 Tax=Crassaminicella profunda TaxID=1286698 RepID=UPI001CA64175|nr:hypothetical protein [Crassaminicella profunda]QZY56697.1 hypothetical protein K7H06_07190 [Crassaminicella profunda]
MLVSVTDIITGVLYSISIITAIILLSYYSFKYPYLIITDEDEWRLWDLVFKAIPFIMICLGIAFMTNEHIDINIIEKILYILIISIGLVSHIILNGTLKKLYKGVLVRKTKCAQKTASFMIIFFAIVTLLNFYNLKQNLDSFNYVEEAKAYKSILEYGTSTLFIQLLASVVAGNLIAISHLLVLDKYKLFTKNPLYRCEILNDKICMYRVYLIRQTQDEYIIKPYEIFDRDRNMYVSIPDEENLKLTIINKSEAIKMTMINEEKDNWFVKIKEKFNNIRNKLGRQNSIQWLKEKNAFVILGLCVISFIMGSFATKHNSFVIEIIINYRCIFFICLMTAVLTGLFTGGVIIKYYRKKDE